MLVFHMIKYKINLKNESSYVVEIRNSYDDTGIIASLNEKKDTLGIGGQVVICQKNITSICESKVFSKFVFSKIVFLYYLSIRYIDYPTNLEGTVDV